MDCTKCSKLSNDFVVSVKAAEVSEYKLRERMWSAALSRSVVSTLGSVMGCSPPGSSVHGDSPGKNTGVGCHALLQRIFASKGSNPGLLHCRWILHCLSHRGCEMYYTDIPHAPGLRVHLLMQGTWLGN